MYGEIGREFTATMFVEGGKREMALGEVIPARENEETTLQDGTVWLEESGYLGLGAADSLFTEEKGATA